MTFIACAAERRGPRSVEAVSPELGRDFRRFNLPVKLALAAAHDVAAAATDAARAFLVALSPCRPGSPELWRAALAFEGALHRTGRATEVRVNPTYTLHAIDNLGLSALAMILQNRAPCLGLGGAPGQAWSALECVLERLGDGSVEEALLFGGDQDPAGEAAAGVALLLSARPRPFEESGRTLRLAGIERRRAPGPASPDPHAASGLLAWLARLEQRAAGRFAYEVPREHGDGIDAITVVVEVA